MKNIKVLGFGALILEVWQQFTFLPSEYKDLFILQKQGQQQF